MIDILCEPSHEDYVRLVNLAKKYCSSFSLVWRYDRIINDNAQNLEKELRPFLLHEEVTNEWPGTRLSNAKALVRHYQLTDESAMLLLTAKSLYAWQEPDLPEDLAIYTIGNECWLFTIAHEEDAAIIDGKISIEGLKASIPGLKVRQRI